MSVMWKLRSVGKSGPVRRATKRFFAAIFRHGHTVRIRTGPLKGMAWYVHRDHQFWMPLGAYEGETAEWISTHLAEGDCFFDIGDNAGYFTLLGGNTVGPTGSVVAFEPVPTNIGVIEKHLIANLISNVEICPVALSNQNGSVEFSLEENNPNSHISSIDIVHARQKVRESFKVRSLTLDDYCRESGRRPTLLKIDVEGGEELVLQGAAETLRTCRPKVLVSCHS